MPKQKPTHHKHTIVVTGSGDFPLDMLRYDSCVPASELDALRMQNAQRGAYKVKLFRFCQEFRPATSARWESFGWRIIFDSADPLYAGQTLETES